MLSAAERADIFHILVILKIVPQIVIQLYTH